MIGRSTSRGRFEDRSRPRIAPDKACDPLTKVAVGPPLRGVNRARRQVSPSDASVVIDFGLGGAALRLIGVVNAPLSDGLNLAVVVAATAFALRH